MDPQLWEEIERGDAQGEIDAIVRLRPDIAAPSAIRIVARFGDIATCRLLRGDILAVRAHPAVRSLKASRQLFTDQARPGRGLGAVGTRRRPRLRETGNGVIVGIVDSGCDFAHAAFRKPDGTTRLRWIWHQGAPTTDKSPEPYRKGRLISREEIDAALREDDPYAALGYHPTRRGATRGAHGTHVMDIAAGNGRGRAPSGMAPDAELIFVHVSSGGTGGLSNFGDSVVVLEAVDFIKSRAGDQPCVINISMGRHGGPHDGTTLIERGFDALLSAQRGFSIVQSAGNYHAAEIHCQGRFGRRGDTARMTLKTLAGNRGTKELEIWYPRGDRNAVTLVSPDGRTRVDVPYDSRQNIEIAGETVGRAYHRVRDPGNQDTHVDIFLYRAAPPGNWSVELTAKLARNGRWHAWIERDGGKGHQTRFVSGPTSKATTGGTIAHGRGAIQVAAHNGKPYRERRYTVFSSAGPTRDGRRTPFVAAPGSKIVAAQSALRGQRNTGREARAESGTSMASPHVAGLVALMLQAAPRARQRQLRGLLAQTALQVRGTNRRDGVRSAFGAVRESAAVRAARRLAALGAPERASPIQVSNEQAFSPAVAISQAEWNVLKNWIAVGAVPTNGAGLLPTNQSVSQSARLPAIPAEAARFIAQALENKRTLGAGVVGSVRRMPVNPSSPDTTLDPLARLILPAFPPTHTEWQMVGAFIETQLNRNRAGTAVGLIGTIDRVNRVNLAHHIACQRLQAFPGATSSPASPYCTFPQNTAPDIAITVLASALTRLGPILDWARVPLDERQHYVMDRLIRRHGLSRNAAAGLVGNMTEESGVLPERLEGSRPATPRFAASRRGARRRHSSRSARTRPATGPRLGGVGLVQWTAGRRAYLFGLQPSGVAIGDFILYFMDGQIDGVIAELAGGGYNRANGVLRRAGVSRNDVSDEIVYSYEIPGSVLEPRPDNPQRRRRRARTDPQVQRIFLRRRRAAANADAAYARIEARRMRARPAPPVMADSETTVFAPIQEMAT